MGSEGGMIAQPQKKLRLLCLHGFRTSGEIMKKQITQKWAPQVLEKLDLIFPDGPFASRGRSAVEGIFDPPYYEWFQFKKANHNIDSAYSRSFGMGLHFVVFQEFSEYENMEECLAYIEELMIKNGPFDGLMGFSQGAILSAALPGLQSKGLALTKVPKIKVVVIISGAKFRSQSLAQHAYPSPIHCSSIHFLGDQDFLKNPGIELLSSYVDPVVIHHPRGHTVPRFDENGLNKTQRFLQTLLEDAAEDKQEGYRTLLEDIEEDKQETYLKSGIPGAS